MPKFQNHDFDNEDYTKTDFVLGKSDINFEEIDNKIKNETIAWQEIVRLNGSEFLH